MTTILTQKITKAYKEGVEKLTEIMQSKTTRFAFAYLEDDKLVQVMPLVKCRDFLKEQILYTYYDRHSQIYGLDTRRHSKNTKEYTGLLLDFGTKGDYQNTLTNFHILVDYEKSLGFKKLSTISIVDDSHLFVMGDPIWQQSCLTISLYSLMLRTLSYKLKDNFQSLTNLNPTSVDSKYWNRMDSLNKITSRDILVDLVAKEDLTKENVNFIHNYTGVYYVLSSKAAFEKSSDDYDIDEIEDYPMWVENWK